MFNGDRCHKTGVHVGNHVLTDEDGNIEVEWLSMASDSNNREIEEPGYDDEGPCRMECCYDSSEREASQD